MNTNDPYCPKRRLLRRSRKNSLHFHPLFSENIQIGDTKEEPTQWLEKPQHYSLVLKQIIVTTIVWHQQVRLTRLLYWLSQKQFLNPHVLRRTLPIFEEHSRYYFPHNMNKNCELLRKKHKIIKFITQCFHAKTEWLI